MNNPDLEGPEFNPILKPGVAKDVSYTVADCIQERISMHPAVIVMIIVAIVVIMVVGLRGQIPGFN